MDKLTKFEWEQAIGNVARKAAEERVKYNRSMGYGSSEGDEDKYTKKYVLDLERRYPYDSIDNDRIERMQDYGSEKVFKWLDFGGISPEDNHKRIEAAKIMPILSGIAKEGEDWYSLSKDKLDAKAAEMGYKPGKTEEYAEFLKKVAGYQTDFDRSKLLKEMQESKEHLAASLAFPALVEGIDNAVATGGDLSTAKALGLGAADAIANGAIMAIPGLRTGRTWNGALETTLRGDRAIFGFNPTASDILNAVLQGGSQGAAEMGRQVAKGVIDDGLEVSYSAPVAAATLGATNPALVGLGAGLASKFGASGREVARGINKTVRSQNPVTVERDQLKNLVKEYNNVQNQIATERNWAEVPNLFGEVLDIGPVPYEIAEADRVIAAQNFPKTAEILGIKPDKNGRYSVTEALEAYDRPVRNLLELGNDNLYRKMDIPGAGGDLAGFMDNHVRYIGQGSESNFATAFPARYADLKERNKNIEAGIVLGNFLNDLGTRVEPTLKLGAPKPSYKDSPWYRKLDPERRRVIDEAFKKKQEEE